MIKPAADKKKKTIAMDAKFLYRGCSRKYYRSMDPQMMNAEVARDLVRALEDATEEVKRSKQLLSESFYVMVLSLMNIVLQTEKEEGTLAHWRWIKENHFGKD